MNGAMQNTTNHKLGIPNCRCSILSMRTVVFQIDPYSQQNHQPKNQTKISTVKGSQCRGQVSVGAMGTTAPTVFWENPLKFFRFSSTNFQPMVDQYPDPKKKLHTYPNSLNESLSNYILPHTYKVPIFKQ